MDRRTFLKSTSLAALMPLGVAMGFSRLRQNTGESESLAASVALAKAAGKPLLVLIGPPPPTKEEYDPWFYNAGTKELAAADLFGYGGADMWLALSCCLLHVSCLKDLHAFSESIGSDQQFTDKTWAVLIDPKTKEPESKIGFQAMVSEIEDRPMLDREWGQKEVHALLTLRVTPRSVQLVTAICGTPELLATRAATARAAIGAEKCKAALQAAVANEKPAKDKPDAKFKPDLASIDAAAAVVFHHNPDSESVKRRLFDAAKARIWAKSPSGGTWATSWGCGIDLLDREGSGGGISCGMGFTPEGSRRFLLFYIPKPGSLNEGR